MGLGVNAIDSLVAVLYKFLQFGGRYFPSILFQCVQQSLAPPSKVHYFMPRESGKIESVLVTVKSK